MPRAFLAHGVTHNRLGLTQEEVSPELSYGVMEPQAEDQHVQGPWGGRDPTQQQLSTIALEKSPGLSYRLPDWKGVCP